MSRSGAGIRVMLLVVLIVPGGGAREARASDRLAQSPGALPPVASRTGSPCEGKAHCAMAGPFAAVVTRVIGARSGKRAAVVATLNVTNVSDRPIILGYKARSGSLYDDAGNRYANEGNDPHRVSGIGYVTPTHADAQFVLAPGASRNASFESHLGIYRGTRLGTVLHFDLVLVVLEVLAGGEVRTLQEYPITFKDLTATS